MAVDVLLNEIGAPFTLENVSSPSGEPRSPEFLKLNPRGAVPVLTSGDFVLREGAAIMSYLADEHKSTLLPTSGQARAKALEWLAFANSTLHPAYGRIFFFHKHLGEKAGENQLYLATVEQIQKLWNEVEQVLTTQDYLAGKECTLGDILTTVIANWTPALKHPITFGPKTKALFNRVIARPAYQKALAAEQVTYKVAA
jgi:glutathione S-transferase